MINSIFLKVDGLALYIFELKLKQDPHVQIFELILMQFPQGHLFHLNLLDLTTATQQLS